jgi:uncharacterized protein
VQLLAGITDIRYNEQLGLPGIGHIIVGLMAFYHAVGSLTQAFTGKALFPLGPPLLHHPLKPLHSIAKVV